MSDSEFHSKKINNIRRFNEPRNQNNMKLSAIVINYNTPEVTAKAIEFFKRAADGLAYEVILIDNASEKRLDPGKLRELEVDLIENQENLGFAKAVNQGAKLARGEYLLLLNSDVLVRPEAVKRALEFLEGHSETAVLGPKFFYPSGKIQASCGNFPTLLGEVMKFGMLSKVLPGGTLLYHNFFNRKRLGSAQAVDWVSGGCMFLRRSVFEQLGYLDEGYFFGFEDIDLCYRAKLSGSQVVYLPTAEIVHYHGLSSGGRRSTWSLAEEARGIERFFSKNLPKRKFTKIMVKLMYQFKILVLNKVFGY